MPFECVIAEMLNVPVILILFLFVACVGVSPLDIPDGFVKNDYKNFTLKFHK